MESFKETLGLDLGVPVLNFTALLPLQCFLSLCTAPVKPIQSGERAVLEHPARRARTPLPLAGAPQVSSPHVRLSPATGHSYGELGPS